MDEIAEQVIKYGEIILQRVWADLDRDFECKTISGDSLTVVYSGTWNLEEGPDFLNAEICINGSVKTGDIEIHHSANDWYIHGHHNDVLYSNVILHVVKSSYAGKTKIPDIQTILVPDFIIYEFLRRNKNKDIQYVEGLCISKFKSLSENLICSYLGKLGINRLNHKIIIYISEILRIGLENAFLKHFFKTCGYKKNKQSFLELYDRISKYDFDGLDDKSKCALLWGESELLPDPGLMKLDKSMHEFVKYTWSKWWAIRKGDINTKTIHWNFSAVRPLNSPYRRIAALSNLFIHLHSTSFVYYLSLFDHKKDDKKIVLLMIDSLKCDDSLWDQYVNFYKKINKPSSLIGRNRALEIIGNLILPFIIAYAKINNNLQLEEKAFSVWHCLPSTQITIIQKISLKRWGLENRKVCNIFKTFASQQGVIFLHKNICEFSHMKCRECPVYVNTQKHDM